MHMLHVRAGLHAHDHRRYVLQLVNAAFRHLCAVIRTYSCLPLLSSLSRGKSRAAERRAGVSASPSGLRSEVCQAVSPRADVVAQQHSHTERLCHTVQVKTTLKRSLEIQPASRLRSHSVRARPQRSSDLSLTPRCLRLYTVPYSGKASLRAHPAHKQCCTSPPRHPPSIACGASLHLGIVIASALFAPTRLPTRTVTHTHLHRSHTHTQLGGSLLNHWRRGEGRARNRAHELQLDILQLPDAHPRERCHHQLQA